MLDAKEDVALHTVHTAGWTTGRQALITPSVGSSIVSKPSTAILYEKSRRFNLLIYTMRRMVMIHMLLRGKVVSGMNVLRW